MPHPYEPQNGQNNKYDLDDMINSAVRFGSSIGSNVLNSVAETLASVGGDTGETDFAHYRRRLVKKLSNPQGGWMTMGVFGWIFCGSFGIAALVMAILSGVAAGPEGAAFAGSPKMVFDILWPIFSACTLGFGFMGWTGCHRANYFGRLRSYLRTAMDYVVPLNTLAKGSVRPLKRVHTDIQKAVQNGQLPNACLDAEGNTLYLDETLYYAQQSAHQSAQLAEQTETDKAKADPAAEMLSEGTAFLRYLQGCRGQLDASADEEIAVMLKTCGAILGYIHNHPEQMPRVRRFKEYYIPTTRKLLDTAMGLGDADADNAQSIRRDITGILHTLNMAYGKLYDTLLQDVSLDVSTEIDTLEAMLRQDGLTHDFESDFGKL